VNGVHQADQIRRKQLRPSRVIKYQAADIKAIRSGLNKSQAEFAMMIGVSKDTLQNWEQGRRRPVGPARALLKIAEENPKAVVEALG
jgi:putative transcriptional regulator